MVREYETHVIIHNPNCDAVLCLDKEKDELRIDHNGRTLGTFRHDGLFILNVKHSMPTTAVMAIGPLMNEYREWRQRPNY